MAAKKWTELEIDVAFDKIWSFWINTEKGDKAPRKALRTLLNSGEDFNKIYEACRIYALASKGDEFTKQLNNFLHDDTWLDIHELYSLEALERERNEAIDLISLWNATCKKHWCKVVSPEERVPIAGKALRNNDFKKYFKKSLDLASRIFEYEFNEKDSRSRISLTFRWFCSVAPFNHTVLKLQEGEFGSPRSSQSLKKKEWKDIPLENRKESLSDFNEIFEDLGIPKSKIENDTKKDRPSPRESSSKAKEIEEEALKKIRQNSQSSSRPSEGDSEEDPYGFR